MIKIVSLSVSVALLAAAGHLKAQNNKAHAAFRRPNIVYVVADQWRAQSLGYMNDANVRTPNLDKLASISVNFTNSVSVLPVCTPYRAALLTGRYPTTTGMFLNDLYLPDREVTLAEVLKDAGYNTAYIGKWHLDGHGRTAFIPRERRQGFDYWKANECTHNYNNSIYYAGDDTIPRYWAGYDVFDQTKDAQKYISTHAKNKKPFVLVLAYGAPHFPHNQAPQKLKRWYAERSLTLRPNVSPDLVKEAKEELVGYYAHCTAIDSAIGNLRNTIEALGIDNNTIFIFTSDHGEMMGSHGVPPKTKQFPWDESILVPFLIRYPSVTMNRGKKVSEPISNVDLMPTLLRLCQIKTPSGIEGEDFSELLTGKQMMKDRAALFMNVAPFNNDKNSEFRGIRTSRYTFVKNINGPPLLFDNDTDPYQMKNLVHDPRYKALLTDMEKILSGKLSEIKDEFKPGDYYIKKWGYHVNKNGAIPYSNEKSIVQSPVTTIK